MAYSVVQKALMRIRGHGRGWSFTPKDFLDLGGRAAVDQALSRLARRGVIRRVGHGVYDYPRSNPKLGVLSPDLHAVAQAVGRKTRARLQVTGAQALNALGLSPQVPATITYLTDGPSRRVRVGKQVIHFRHVTPRRLVGAGLPWSAVAQALWFLGKDGVSTSAIHRLKDVLPPDQRSALLKADVPDWLRPALKQLAQDS